MLQAVGEAFRDASYNEFTISHPALYTPKEAVEASLTRIASRITGKIHTRVLPYTGFTLAEDYHQKHALRRSQRALEELRRMYPNSQGLVASTAAARVNGYLAGYGQCEQLQEEIDELGLSPKGSKRLLEKVCGKKALQDKSSPR